MTAKLDACAARLDSLNGRLGNLEAQGAADRVAKRADGDERQDWNAYPSYTLADLKRFLERDTLDADKRKSIEKEISERESGKSVHRKTPQVGWR